MDIRIKAGELKGKKLFLGTPMYGGLCVGMFARSIADLSALCTHYGINLQLFFLFNESLITRARNYIADEFVRSDAEHLMWIDADIGFDARDVIALFVLQIQNPDYDIIGAPYAKKCISWEKIKAAVDAGKADKDPNELDKYVGDFVFNPKGGATSIPIHQPVEVLEIGTGFMMVRKNTFTKFAEANPEYLYRPDHARTVHFDGSRKIMQYFQAEIDEINYAKEYRKLLNELANNDTFSKDVLNTKLKEIDEKADKYSLRYLSEDYWFSQKCQLLNLKTFLCPWMKLQHFGNMVFGGSLADLASIGVSATTDVDKLKKKITVAK